MKIYELRMPADCEGRSTHVVGRFLKKIHAEKVGLGQVGNASMGPDNGRVTALTVYEDLTEFVGDRLGNASEHEKVKLLGLLDAPTRRKALRKAALAKLTDDEKAALGVGS